MDPIRRAVIDIGTNSVKLLVADVSAAGSVEPLSEQSRQTRLGQGFYNGYRLQPSTMKQTAEAVAHFAEKAGADGARLIKVIATSAVRDAVNAQEFTATIQQACGLTVEVISGQQEAEWAFRGAMTDASLAREAVMIADLGGGSAQFILGHQGRKTYSLSCPLGTLRLLETLPHSDPPQAQELAACREWVARFIDRELKPEMVPALAREKSTGGSPLILVGTGGTASILGCMEAKLDHFDRACLEHTRLTQERLRWHTRHLWSLPLTERKQVVGLPANRADVILYGSVIYEAVLQGFGFNSMRVSTRGLRFAALLGS